MIKKILKSNFFFQKQVSFIPYILKFVGTLKLHTDRIHETNWIIERYYLFLYFNVLLGSTIGGSVFRVLDQILINGGIGFIISILAYSLPQQAVLFINYTIAHNFIWIMFFLLKPFKLVMWIINSKKAKTKREKRLASKKSHFPYHRTVPQDLLVLTLVLVFSTMFPLIIFFGIFYFITSWLIRRFYSIYSYSCEYDGGGMVFDTLFSRTMVALLTYQVVMVTNFLKIFLKLNLTKKIIHLK